MEKAAYAELLTQEERADSIKLGAVLHAAHHGIKPKTDEFSKYAQLVNPGEIGSGLARTILALSLVTGIPAGIVWHQVNKGVKKRTGAEESLKKNIDFYRDASSSLENEMARQGVTV